MTGANDARRADLISLARQWVEQATAASGSDELAMAVGGGLYLIDQLIQELDRLAEEDK